MAKKEKVTAAVTELNEQPWKKFTIESSTWVEYFPTRVELTRQDVHRLCAALATSADNLKKSELNAFKDIAEIQSVLVRNLDSALRFKQDEHFILLTKAEYDKLTAPKA